MLSRIKNHHSHHHADHHSTKFAQTLCTIVTHTSPTTIISDTGQHSILLKTRGPIFEVLAVAPNVVGSNPISHPKHSVLP